MNHQVVRPFTHSGQVKRNFKSPINITQLIIVALWGWESSKEYPSSICRFDRLLHAQLLCVYVCIYKYQCQAMRREFESIGPILLKKPLGARWGLLPMLKWVASWFPIYLTTSFK